MNQPENISAPDRSLAALDSCQLCPRLCRADRNAGKVGFCGAGRELKIYRWGAHHGEEPPISGERGSGTIFFSHCTLTCLYCQNYQMSQLHEGTLYNIEGLAAIMADLSQRGCHNWNLVTPTPWLPQLRAALAQVRRQGLALPLVYNTSGYERIEIVSEYRELMDIVLTDLRYADPATAAEASTARDLVQRARDFAAWAWRTVGPLEVDRDGIARRGLICRLLVLPGRAAEAIANLEWLAENIGTDVHISLMSQYTPVHRATRLPGWDRRIGEDEYRSVTDRLEDLGFENGWVQEWEPGTDESLLGWRMQPQF